MISYHSHASWSSSQPSEQERKLRKTERAAWIITFHTAFYYKRALAALTNKNLLFNRILSLLESAENRVLSPGQRKAEAYHFSCCNW